MSDSASTPCPFPDTHRRLVDVHELWHELTESYMDPRLFRRRLNLIIPELRNVSFVMQKEGRDSDPDFDSWYQPWVKEIATDDVMKWVTRSRNRVVKEGDLSLLSRCSVQIRNSWTDTQELHLDLPPSVDLASIAALARRETAHRAEVIIVRREWVDYDMPKQEILAATAHAFERCLALVKLAHIQADASMKCEDIDPITKECDFREDSNFLRCMSGVDRYYQVSMNGHTGELYRENIIVEDYDEDSFEEAREHFGDFPKIGRIASVESAIDAFVKIGQHILRSDDDLLPVVAFFDESKIVDWIGTPIADKAANHLTMLRVAERAARPDVKHVLFSFDSWMARLDGSRPHTSVDYLLPVHLRVDRQSAFCVVVASRSGNIAERNFTHARGEDGTVSFTELSEPTTHWNHLEPLRQAWKIDAWKTSAKT